MKIAELTISHFESIEHCVLHLAPQLNFLCLDNDEKGAEIIAALASTLFSPLSEISSGISSARAEEASEGEGGTVRLIVTLDSQEKSEITRSAVDGTTKARVTENQEKRIRELQERENGALSLASCHLGISEHAFRNIAMIGASSDVPKNLSDLELRIRALADTAAEDRAFDDIQKDLLSQIEIIGSEDDPSTPLGSISTQLQGIEEEKKRINAAIGHYSDESAQITELRDKQADLGKKLKEFRDNSGQESSLLALERAGRLLELKSSLADLEASLRSLAEEKERLTRLASDTRSLIKEHEEFLHAPDQVIPVIEEYEETIMAVKDSLEEKEKLAIEVQDKEREIRTIIEKLSRNFDRFKNAEEFEEAICGIEKNLGQANVINEKMMSIPKMEQDLRRLQWLTFIYLIFSFSFILLVVTVLFSQLVLSSVFEGTVILICPFFCFYLLMRLWQQEQAFKALKKKRDDFMREINRLKSSVEEARRQFGDLKEGLNISTSTDLRARHREYLGALKDLESLHQITDVYSMVKLKIDDEKNKLEANARRILENCRLLAPDEPVTHAILKKFRENYEYARSLIKDQEKYRQRYDELSSSIEQGVEERKRLEEELRIRESPASPGTESEGSPMSKDEPDEAREIFYDLEELEASYDDYDGEIKESAHRIAQFFADGRCLADAEEELSNLKERKRDLLEEIRFLEIAYDSIEVTGAEFRAQVFCPDLGAFLEKSAAPEKLHLDRSFIERITKRIAGAAKDTPVSRDGDEEAGDEVPLRLIYILFKIAAAQVIAGENENIPIFIDQEGLPGSPADGVVKLLALATGTRNQIICMCKGSDEIRSALRLNEIPFQEETTDICTLIRA
jgi:hypothetical protein